MSADFSYESPVEKDYECPICFEVQREAYLTRCCGTHFCFVCIGRVIKDKKPCPLCKHEPLEIFPNKDRQRKIDDLRVFCQYVSKENCGARCDWRGESRDFERHVHNENGQATTLQIAHLQLLIHQRTEQLLLELDLILPHPRNMLMKLHY